MVLKQKRVETTPRKPMGRAEQSTQNRLEGLQTALLIYESLAAAQVVLLEELKAEIAELKDRLG